MANLKILIESVDSADQIQTEVDAQKPAPTADMLDYMIRLLQEIQLGRKAGSVLRMSAADDQASATAELDTVIAGDELTIGVVTLTGAASPANEDEFEIGGDDAETASNLADCINAHSVLSNVVEASADDVVVTLTCVVAGSIGNQIPLSADSTITLSGSSLENGTDENNVTKEM